MKYRPTTATRKIAELLQTSNDVYIVQGGQGAGKTISILMILINDCIYNQIEVAVLSEELTKMRRTVVSDFIKILKDFKIFKDSSWNKTSLIYTFHNGSIIEFIGMDKEDVGKGLRRNICYFNEANKVKHESYIQVASRSDINILDYNPDSKFWGTELINKDNYLVLTYKDNEFLSENEINSILDYKVKGFRDTDIENYDIEQNIKSKYWANKWRVYGLGVTGLIDGIVFNNWTIIDGVPEGARLLGRGMDFGYSNDPTTLIDIYEWQGKTVIDEVIYAINLLTSDIVKIYNEKGLDKNVLIVADSADPKAIKELQQNRIKVIGATKGADSIVYGIDKLQDKELLITSKSTSTINEFENYSWKKDKSGNSLNIPIDMNNHSIDAIRYLLLIAQNINQYLLIQVMQVEVNSFKEILNTDFDVSTIIDVIMPRNEINGVIVMDFISMEFQKVCDIVRVANDKDIANLLHKVTNIEPETLLELKANDVCMFISWVKGQLFIIAQLQELLQNDSPTKEDIDLQNAGIDKLDVFEEWNIYYSISKNPCDWDSLGKIPYSKMYTKIKMDKVNKEISDKYSEIIKGKKL